MYIQTPQANRRPAGSAQWRASLQRLRRSEPGRAGGDAPGHGSGDHSADDGGDDRPGSTRVAEAAGKAKAAGDYDTRKPGGAYCAVGDEAVAGASRIADKRDQ